MAHALKDRQILAWAGITKGWAAVVALLLMGVTWLLAEEVWFPLWTHFLGIDIPETLKQVIVGIAVTVQFFTGLGNVPTGVERAQKFMGQYTDVSFPPGIYLLPRLPLPLVTLVLMLWESPLAKYFAGWMLEDDVSVNDRTISIEVSGLTADGVRIELLTVLILRVAKAAVYLYQTQVNADESNMLASIEAQSVEKIRADVVARKDARSLHQENLQGSRELADAITQACSFVEDYGLIVAKLSHTKVNILNKQVEQAFDRAQGKDVFIAGAESLAETFAAFKLKLPEGTSEEAALMLFNAERIDNGQQPAALSILKLK